MKPNLSILSQALGAAATVFFVSNCLVATVCAAEDADSKCPVTLNLDAGTLGAGGSLSCRFFDHWGARAGVDYLKYNRTGEVRDVNFNANLKLLTQPLTVDYYPWKARSFRVSGGVMLNENRFNGSALSGSTTINGTQYTLSSANPLTLDIKQNLVDPYLSISGDFFYFDHSHHFGFGGELGAAYTGNSKVSLSNPGGNISKTDLESERSKIQKYANYVKFWPVLKLQFSFRF